MKTVLECKNEYAKSIGYEAWGLFLIDADKAELSMALNVVAQDYAQERVNSALQEAAEKKWIEAGEEKPKPATPVIVFGINSFGKKRTLRAMWVPKFFLESDGEYFDYADYHEEKDEYYWPEGWYERNEYDEVNWHIEHLVTHWQPLPDEPISLQIKDL